MERIYWKDLLVLVQSTKNKPQNIEIDFKNEPVDFKNASILNRYGYRVPENLIQYDDSELDFSDDADLTDDELENANNSLPVNAHFILDTEIKQWLKAEKIEINSLIPRLMKNFYETVKYLNNNAAI